MFPPRLLESGATRLHRVPQKHAHAPPIGEDLIRTATVLGGPGSIQSNRARLDPIDPGRGDAMEVSVCARKRFPCCWHPAEPLLGSWPSLFPRAQAEVLWGAVPRLSAVRRSCLLPVLVSRFRLPGPRRPAMRRPMRRSLRPATHCPPLRRRTVPRLLSSNKHRLRESCAANSRMSRPRPHHRCSTTLPCVCPRPRSSAWRT
jgi:hypothetical protein